MPGVAGLEKVHLRHLLGGGSHSNYGNAWKPRQIWSCEEWDERLADVRETLEMNGVPAHDMEPLDDLWDWGACSYNSDNGGLVLGVDLHLLVTPPSLMATAVPRTSGAQRRRC